jgi:hypothetical protein
MARKNDIRIRRSDTSGSVPLVSDLELGELAVNTVDGKLFLKKDVEGLESIVEFVSKVPVENVIYVQKAGNDDNDGNSWDSAVATLEKALELADARAGLLTLIDIGPGEYITQGHLDMPDNCMIRAVHRTVIFKPEEGYEERNVIRMGSGCFIEGPLFEGWRLDDLDNPTEGFAISFRPGAVITRAPYAHKIAVRSIRTWDYIAPPLDRANQNPLVGIGAGVVLADGAVCSPYSIFPNIMTWGATPVTHNGIGYCAKNGALINAVNAVSMWAHKHFLALSGGQIILSSCSTQFGDYTLVASGTRNLILPTEIEDVVLTTPVEAITSFSLQIAAGTAIRAAKPTIIDNMWAALVSGGYTTGWTAQDETYTRRDAGTFLDAIARVLETASESYMLNFQRGLFFVNGTKVYDLAKESAFIYSFEYMRDQINALGGVNSTSQGIVTALVAALNSCLSSPNQTSNITLSVQTDAAADIVAAKTIIANNTWTALVNEGYTTTWTEDDEIYTKRDAGTLLQSLSWVLQSTSEKPMLDFAKGLFKSDGTKVYDSNKEEAFLFSFNYIRDQVQALANVNSTSDTIVSGLISALNDTIRYPNTRSEPSTITAIGHTWTAIMAGVALTKIPPARNFATIEESILELNQGRVIASGQDDQGSALFIGGMKIDADTGELSGPPFEQAVNRIATRTSIARSF